MRIEESNNRGIAIFMNFKKNIRKQFFIDLFLCKNVSYNILQNIIHIIIIHNIHLEDVKIDDRIATNIALLISLFSNFL